MMKGQSRLQVMNGPRSKGYLSKIMRKIFAQINEHGIALVETDTASREIVASDDEKVSLGRR